MFEASIKIQDTGFGAAIAQVQDQIPAMVEGVVLFAAQITIDTARPGVPTVTGKAAKSLQAFLSGGLGIAQGGGVIDYYRWLELGGESGRAHANRRPVIPEGRYIWPAYQRKEDEIRTEMESAVNKLVASAGLE